MDKRRRHQIVNFNRHGYGLSRYNIMNARVEDTGVYHCSAKYPNAETAEIDIKINIEEI